MPIRTHAEYWKRYLAERGDYGITARPATEPPTTTTTCDRYYEAATGRDSGFIGKHPREGTRRPITLGGFLDTIINLRRTLPQGQCVFLAMGHKA